MNGISEMAHVARLFGRLLIREIDPPLLRELQKEELSKALQELGIKVPEPDALELLSAEYCGAFLVSEDPVPLVQSLWEKGSYEGQSVEAIRELAKAAGMAFDREQARGAPLDHLGSILILWAALSDWKEAQDHLAQKHLSWAIAPLQKLSAGNGFYSQIASATLELIAEIQSYSPPSSPEASGGEAISLA